MKHLSAIGAILVFSSGLALAQTSGGTGSATGASSPGAATPGVASPTNPGASPSPGANPPAPSDVGTTGRAPGVNPANPQDMTRRGNPQDMTLPRASNPQDSKATGTPQIYIPERRR